MSLNNDKSFYGQGFCDFGAGCEINIRSGWGRGWHWPRRLVGCSILTEVKLKGKAFFISELWHSNEAVSLPDQ
jgi:hypothetical protein